MLEAAQRRRKEGIDLLVGILETHGRAETELLLDGLDVLPRKLTPRLEEFVHRPIRNTRGEVVGELRVEQ